MPEKDDAYYATLTDADFLKDFHGPAMYTTEGDDAVRYFCAAAADIAATNLTVRNKATLTAALKDHFALLKAAFPEVTDTEPRGWIATKLDEICEAHGWKYEPYEAYDLY